MFTECEALKAARKAGEEGGEMILNTNCSQSVKHLRRHGSAGEGGWGLQDYEHRLFTECEALKAALW